MFELWPGVTSKGVSTGRLIAIASLIAGEMTEIAPVVLGDRLVAPPTDGVSALRFSQESDLLLAASWDRTVRIYDASLNQARGVIEHRAPVLSVCLRDDISGFSGGLDGQVRR